MTARAKTTNDRSPAPVEEPFPETTKRARWPWIAGGGLVLIGATVAAVILLGGEGGEQDAVPTAGEQLSFAVVESRDFVEFLELDGTLTYDDSVGVTATREGRLTDVAAEGDIVEHGDTIYEIDQLPTVVFYGDVPAYRQLSEGVEPGQDVADLELNLVALGYDDDHQITVDETFDEATAAAVVAWQEDHGIDQTGEMGPADYVVVAGPIQVQQVAARPGDSMRTETPIAEAAVIAVAVTVPSPVAGELFTLPAVGTTFSTGDIAFETFDDVVPVVIGDEPLTRELSEGSEGDDVRQLEEALVELGYDAGGDLEVDDVFDEATTDAVTEWEDDLGQDADGIVSVGQYLVIREGLSVTEVHLEPTAPIAVGEPIFDVGASQRVVTAEVLVADQAVAGPGTEVTVVLPDGNEVTAFISSVGAVAKTPAGDPEGDPVLILTIDVAAVASMVNLVEAPVDVLIAGDIATDVTVVPASALVALREGGYAVEVRDGAGTRLVGVDTGAFSDGYVEVTGDGIAPGVEVVVP